jgi:membrane-bound transcription factor site-1 protease
MRRGSWARCGLVLLVGLGLVAGSSGAPFTVKSHPVKREFIVHFRGYLPPEEQRRILEEGMGDGHWEFVDVARPFTRNAPSDFATIRVARPGDESTLLGHPRVRSVVPERRIFLASAKKEPGPASSKDLGSLGTARLFGSTHHVLARGVPEEGRRRGRRLSQFVSGSSDGQGSGRRLLSISDSYDAKRLWQLGFAGKDVKVAIFDTGIDAKHRSFNHIEDRSNWTDEDTLEDRLGHGTFVAGVVASKHPDCHGFAEEAEIHTFRVFTQRQMSFTSWFLDAFNYAIQTRMNILNLSIGGPDYHDQPFIDKVWEMSANNIIVVSAIGNDGPLWGTLNNPADQPDVIGVGGIDYKFNLAAFSSRGMTTWELPGGYGRVKPDIVAYGKDVPGSSIPGQCRSLSGTSVASPVVAGAVTLLASTVPLEKRSTHLNPASMKQALVESATKLPTLSLFEQGAGHLNLFAAYEALQRPLRVTVFPAHWDLALDACPYMWPFCTQATYAGAQPLIINATILNSMAVSGRVAGEVRWVPGENGECLDVRVEHAPVIWPWSGYLAVFVRVKSTCAARSAIALGALHLTVESPPEYGSATRRSGDAQLTMRVQIIPTPPREKRVLWDHFHNVQYPPGFFPRDNLAHRDFLDWNGDHPHTNFRALYAKVCRT